MTLIRKVRLRALLHLAPQLAERHGVIYNRDTHLLSIVCREAFVMDLVRQSQ